MDMNDIEVIEPLTPIQKFYSNVNVFITGGTGLIGRVLIEKLLRSCPDIANIYVLVRENRGEDANKRVKNLFRDVFFNVVKANFPNVTAKVVAIAGDCTLPNLGLSENDKSLLIENINIVFHSAAVTRPATLKTATRVNVIGTHEVLKLCIAMKHLKSVVHVSSAYAHCDRYMTFERFYRSPAQAKSIMSLATNTDDRLMEQITAKLLGKHPNTFTFTKALAEELVEEFGKTLPIAVIRPSLVISTYEEPIKGYVNSFYGLSGIMIAVSCGLLSSFHCNPKDTANVVPADMCVSAMIAISVDTAKAFQASTDDTSFETPVYHFESSLDQHITWEEYVSKTVKNALQYPPVQSLWYHSISLQKHYTFHYFIIMCFHFLPGLFRDLIMVTFGQTPWFTKTTRVMLKMTTDMSYYTTRNFAFVSKKLHYVIERMTSDDQNLFFCDLRKLYWDEYFESYFLGMRIHVLRDPIETVSTARMKMKRLYVMQKIMNLISILICIFFVFYLSY